MESTVPPAALESRDCDLDALALLPTPAIADYDLAAYRFDDSGSYHQFRLRPAAVARLAQLHDPLDAAFVLTVNDERIYLGAFRPTNRRAENTLPTVIVDFRDSFGTFGWPLDRFCIAPARRGSTRRRDPRIDRRFVEALRSLDLLKPLDNPAWTEPLSDRTQQPDGASGVRVRVEKEIAAVIRDSQFWHAHVFGEAVRVDDVEKRPVATADLDENHECRLTLAPGVYYVHVAVHTRCRGMPPQLTGAVCLLTPGDWLDLFVERYRLR